jgi:hypothetical protein
MKKKLVSAFMIVVGIFIAGGSGLQLIGEIVVGGWTTSRSAWEQSGGGFVSRWPLAGIPVGLLLLVAGIFVGLRKTRTSAGPNAKDF